MRIALYTSVPGDSTVQIDLVGIRNPNVATGPTFVVGVTDAYNAEDADDVY